MNDHSDNDNTVDSGPDRRADNHSDSNAAKSGGPNRERRSFFRINQDIVLDYRVVEAYTANHEDAGSLFQASPLSELLSALRRIDAESGQLLHSITENNRQIADYLGNINRKIELLTQHMLMQDSGNQQLVTTSVNLSEGGIAFATEKPVYKGSFLALRLLFLPSYVSVVVFAQVVRSETGKDERHQLAAKFHRLQEQQAQVLSRQIMQAQLEAKRRRQQASGAAAGN